MSSAKRRRIHEEVQNGNLGMVLTEEEVAVAETKERNKVKLCSN